MDRYVKATTNYHGVQAVPIFRRISYDKKTEQTLVEQKIFGSTVVECDDWTEDGDLVEEIYQIYLKWKWEDSSEPEFNARPCNRHRKSS